MRTLTWLLVPSLLASCAPGDGANRGTGADLFDSISPHQPAPRFPIPDSVAEALYEKVWSAIDPGDGYRDYRYLEFDWVLWNGSEVLRRNHRYSPWEGHFRVAVTLDGQDLVAVGNWKSPSPTMVWIDGEEVLGDSALILTHRAERMFELDANLLLLPFRLADLGVHTVHTGAATTDDGRAVETLEVTFQGDGSRAEPKFVIWVDSTTGLPTRTFSYRSEAATQPTSVTDWVDWSSFGPLMLSTRRTSGGSGEIRIENIRVDDALPAGRFRGPQD